MMGAGIGDPAEGVHQLGGLKLYGPSQEQSGKAGHATTSGPAWKWVNSPVPPENRPTPERAAGPRPRCPNAGWGPGRSRRGPLPGPPASGPAARDVPVRGLQAESQLVGNRAAGPALGDEQHDLLLDRGQLWNGHVGDLLFR